MLLNKVNKEDLFHRYQAAVNITKLSKKKNHKSSATVSRDRSVQFFLHIIGLAINYKISKDSLTPWELILAT